MKAEDLLLMGLAIVAGIGIGVAIMTFMRQQQPIIYQPPNPLSTNTESPKIYFIDRPQQQVAQPQQSAQQIIDRVLNEETMVVNRGPDGEFLGYTIHRDVKSKK